MFDDTMEKIIDKFDLRERINNPIHGISHWKRVKELGRYLAKYTGADTTVTDYFAYFHDLQRENDNEDIHHGLEGAALFHRASEEGLLDFNKMQWVQMIIACTFHCYPDEKSKDITIQTCWDADRLDFWRLGIKPDPLLLNTNKAKEMETIEFAKKLFEISK